MDRLELLRSTQDHVSRTSTWPWEMFAPDAKFDLPAATGPVAEDQQEVREAWRQYAECFVRGRALGGARQLICAGGLAGRRGLGGAVASFPRRDSAASAAGRRSGEAPSSARRAAAKAARRCLPTTAKFR
jgi:hypothetical protein